MLLLGIVVVVVAVVVVNFIDCGLESVGFAVVEGLDVKSTEI
jgi:hypothetical protein